MALPKIDLPIYECELPSTGKNIKYVPFTVKEEKILLTAQESKDPKQMMLALKQIINNCLVDYDVDKLAIFDIEYLLIQIRSRSVDNVVDFEIEDPETKEKIKLVLDLSDVKIQKSADHTNKIKLSEEYVLFMKYPTIDQFQKMIEDKDQTPESSYEIILSCLDKLASQTEVFNFKDSTKEEIEEFMDGLHGDVVKKIKLFFSTMPKTRHEIQYKNSNGTEKTFVLEGTETFFI